MRRPLPTRLAAILSAVAVLLVGCTTSDGTDGTGPSGSYDVSTGTGPLPEASFAALRDPDTQVSTTDWEGTPTVVNFWATWCGFCTEEMPDLEAAFQQLDGEVRFVGIDRQDPRDAALDFLDETGVTYDQVASPDGAYYEQLGARGMPTTLFVDADGVVQFRHTGPLTRQDVLDLVDEHLGVTG